MAPHIFKRVNDQFFIAMGKFLYIKTTIIITIIQLMNTALAFVFGMCLAHYFGTSAEMDAYVAVSNLIAIIFTLFSQTQSKVFIPYLAKFTDKNEKINILASILNFNTLVFLGVTVTMYLLSDYIAIALAPKLSAYQHALSSNFIKISAFYLFATTLFGLGTAVCHLHNKFIFVALLELLKSISLISFFFILKEDITIYSIPTSHLLSIIICLPFCAYYFVKQRYRFNSPLPIFNLHIRKYINLIIPIVLAQILQSAVRLSDTFIASFLDPGSISQLSYCLRITANVGILFSALYTIYFPILSKLNSVEHNIAHRDTFGEGYQTLVTASLGVTVFLCLFAKELIELIFVRGAFTTDDMTVVSQLLLGYSIYMLISPLGTFATNTYYSRQEGKRSVIYSTISLSTNIILNIILSYFYGVFGLALASSLGAIVGHSLQITNLRKINDQLTNSYIFKKITPVFLSAILVAIPILLIKTFLFPIYPNILASKIFYLGTFGIIYSIFYIFTTATLGVSFTKALLKKLTFFFK